MNKCGLGLNRKSSTLKASPIICACAHFYESRYFYLKPFFLMNFHSFIIYKSVDTYLSHVFFFKVQPTLSVHRTALQSILPSQFLSFPPDFSRLRYHTVANFLKKKDFYKNKAVDWRRTWNSSICAMYRPVNNKIIWFVIFCSERLCIGKEGAMPFFFY